MNKYLSIKHEGTHLKYLTTALILTIVKIKHQENCLYNTRQHLKFNTNRH